MLLSLAVLYLALVAVAENESDIMEIKTKRFQSVILPCPAKLTAGVEYRAVRWYKEGVAPRLTGLLTKDLPDGRMRWFVGASTQISLVQHTLNLQLPNVSCSHRGVYQCYLAAPVGQQNREGRVRLAVSDCPTDIEKTPVTAEQLLKENFLLVAVAGLVSLIALGISALTYRKLKNRLRVKTKSLQKELHPDLSHPPEKQELI